MNVRFAQIPLKNSHFCVDHNLEDRWQSRWKISKGIGGRTGFAACDPPRVACRGGHQLRGRYKRRNEIFAVAQLANFSTISANTSHSSMAWRTGQMRLKRKS
jgi:hypothetical protein